MRAVFTFRRRGEMAGTAGKPAAPSPRRRYCTPMLLALMLGVCTYLLVATVGALFFGDFPASLVGFGLLIFFVLVCWGICAFRVPPGKE